MSFPNKESNDWYSLQERALKLSDQAFKNLVGEYEDQIRNLKFEINSRDQKISDLKNKLEFFNKQINLLKSEKNELCSLLDALEEKYRSKDKKIQEAFNELAKLKNEHEIFLNRIEKYQSKFNDISIFEIDASLKEADLSEDIDNRSLLCEQNEKIEFKEIPDLMMTEVLMHPSNFIADNKIIKNIIQSNSSKICNSPHENINNSSGDFSSYNISKSGIWNRISQVLPSEAYFSLLNFVRQYHLGLINEEELQTEIQNTLLSNNEAVQNAFAKDIFSLSSK